MTQTEVQDLIVIGGGINGAGIARDAAGRGLNVTICEQKDFAASTSSASSKLIHGGLRYLEHYEFGLVRKSLIEREVLLNMAPHIIWPLRFVLPHHPGLRPAFILRLGLFLYDYMGGRKILPPTEKVRFRGDLRGQSLQPTFKVGFEYSDCWVDDARLVLLNVMDAAKKGANILKGWRCISAERKDNLWQVRLENQDGEQQAIQAKALVNASGSWAADIANAFQKPDRKKHKLRLVKGSHIILPKLYEGDHAYTFQEADGRVIFAIPYETDFTLVGTTDVPFKNDPADVNIDGNEISYLCKTIGEYLKTPVKEEDVVWHYAGVRPLIDDGEENASKVSRDYILKVSDDDGHAPLLSVFGGKVTTYRKLAEQALDKLADYFDHETDAWTAGALLPGGDIGGLSHDDYLAQLKDQYPWAPVSMLERFVRLYGSRTHQLLEGSSDIKDLGLHFGHDLYEKELVYLRDHEWATTGEDVLWRRTKLGLHLSDVERESVINWMAKK